jgi:hypothetical protein
MAICAFPIVRRFSIASVTIAPAMTIRAEINARNYAKDNSHQQGFIRVIAAINNILNQTLIYSLR